MKDVIGWVLLSVAAVGGFIAIGLVVYLAILPKEEEDLFSCCDECNGYC